ncbi:unnamed protein product [Albugo candida]|uniref:RxLR effector protein n=1 Tax=Albugo candida TaxID=65357 RepID=A0A024G1C5_9STRA|nr:unnamed protein product [Albugo candida]|eukprot:CCI40346.1 unnamed protein product [Albugo candida]
MVIGPSNRSKAHLLPLLVLLVVLTNDYLCTGAIPNQAGPQGNKLNRQLIDKFTLGGSWYKRKTELAANYVQATTDTLKRKVKDYTNSLSDGITETYHNTKGKLATFYDEKVMPATDRAKFAIVHNPTIQKMKSKGGEILQLISKPTRNDLKSLDSSELSAGSSTKKSGGADAERAVNTAQQSKPITNPSTTETMQRKTVNHLESSKDESSSDILPLTTIRPTTKSIESTVTKTRSEDEQVMSDQRKSIVPPVGNNGKALVLREGNSGSSTGTVNHERAIVLRQDNSKSSVGTVNHEKAIVLRQDNSKSSVGTVNHERTKVSDEHKSRAIVLHQDKSGGNKDFSEAPARSSRLGQAVEIVKSKAGSFFSETSKRIQGARNKINGAAGKLGDQVIKAGQNFKTRIIERQEARNKERRMVPPAPTDSSVKPPRLRQAADGVKNGFTSTINKISQLSQDVRKKFTEMVNNGKTKVGEQLVRTGESILRSQQRSTVNANSERTGSNLRGSEPNRDTPP